MPALERFARYRGLKSFRTTPWNPKWNLPRSYARAYQFKHFKRTQKRVLATEAGVEEALKKQQLEELLNKNRKKGSKGGDTAGAGAGAGAGAETDEDMGGLGVGEAGYVLAGGFVCLHIPNVPVARVAARDKGTPLVVGGLLK